MAVHILLTDEAEEEAKRDMMSSKNIVNISNGQVLATPAKDMVIGFNPHYLIDVLKNLEDESVGFEITDSEKPGVIRSNGYIYLVLPIRLA